MGYQLNQDFSTVAPDEGTNSIRYFPPSDSRGWLVQMVESDGKENSSKSGIILATVLQGLEGPVQGKFADWTINVTNPSQKAVEIGQGQMSAIAHVTGHIRVGNSVEWHNKPFRVVVEVDQKADLEKYPNSTRIAKILDVNGNSAKEAGKGVMGGNQTQGQQGVQAGGNAGWGNQQQQQPQGQNFSQQNGGNGSQGAQGNGSFSNAGNNGNFQPAQNNGAGFDPQSQGIQGNSGNFQQGQQPQGQQFQGGNNFQQNNGNGPGWNQ
jgi:hypothetical protein